MVLLTGIHSNAQSVAKSTTEAVNATSEGATTPDSVMWLIGAVLVILFTFIIIFALAKGAMAMSENIRVNLPAKK
jgi:hypothetical protein